MLAAVNPAFINGSVLPLSSVAVYPSSPATTERAVNIPSVINEVQIPSVINEVRYGSPSPQRNRQPEIGPPNVLSFENMGSKLTNLQTAHNKLRDDMTNYVVADSHNALSGRVASIERLVHEEVVRYTQEMRMFRESRQAVEQQKSVLQSRLDYLERLIDAQNTVLQEAKDDIQRGHAKLDSDLSQLRRNSEEVGSSVGSHTVQFQELSSNMENRLNSVEALCKESLEKYSQVLNDIGRASAEKTIMDQQNLEKLSDVDQVKGRIDYIEQFLSQYQKKQSSSIKELQDRFLMIEAQVGDSLDSHDSLRSAMEGLQTGVDRFSALHKLTEHHASLLERIDYLERLLGESADRHGIHEEHKNTMDQRVTMLERFCGETADQTKRLSSLSDLGDSRLGARVECIEDFVGVQLAPGVDIDQYRNQPKPRATVDTRLKYLEGMEGLLERPITRTSETIIERPITRTETIIERPSTWTAETMIERPIARTVETMIERPIARTAETMIERPIARAAVQVATPTSLTPMVPMPAAPFPPSFPMVPRPPRM